MNYSHCEPNGHVVEANVAYGSTGVLCCRVECIQVLGVEQTLAEEGC